jgi:HK97 family phage major capsid protein
MTITFPALTEVEGRLKAKRDELAVIFTEAGPEMDLAKVKALDGDIYAKAAAIKALNDEMTDLGAKADELRGVARAATAVRDGEEKGETSDDQDPGEDRRTKRTLTFGEAFVKSGAGGKLKGRVVELDVELKTLFETATGWVPEATRGPRVILDAQRPVQVVDFIPQTTTNQNAVTFMEETTFTNAAAETAEGVAKPEAALALTEQTSPVRKIAVWIPVTDEQLEDVPRIQQYLDNRLGFMVRQRLDLQIISGNGTAPNISGMLDIVGIQTQAKGADPTPDAVYKAITKVNVTGQAMANLVIFHPNDWQDVRLLRTVDGIYIWGNPSDAGPERIWGLPVAVVQAATENTAIVVDTSFTELAMKKGLEVKVSDSHGDFFIENKQAVRAELRAAFIVYRPAAICSVTGV